VVLLDISGRDFSVLGLVRHADPVVQAIMLGLVVASVACWALILEKSVRLRRLNSQVKQLEARAAEPRGSLENLQGLGRDLNQSAMAEIIDGASRDETRNDVRARIERALKSAMKAELKRIEVGLPFLATVGSATPFVGLFGTVWGIMHSFTAIAQSKDTSLAVVAPGIAEALFATALGLAAAIPAVIAYNQITVSLGRYADRINATIATFAKRMSKHAGPAQHEAEVRSIELSKKAR
jgi:TolQ protein